MKNQSESPMADPQKTQWFTGENCPCGQPVVTDGDDTWCSSAPPFASAPGLNAAPAGNLPPGLEERHNELLRDVEALRKEKATLHGEIARREQMIESLLQTADRQDQRLAVARGWLKVMAADHPELKEDCYLALTDLHTA